MFHLDVLFFIHIYLDAIIFVSIDILSLVVQAIGGGMASKAVRTIGGNANKGGHVMLGAYGEVSSLLDRNNTPSFTLLVGIVMQLGELIFIPSEIEELFHSAA